MYISQISLFNYRNFKNLEIFLDPKINIFYGDNAQGKTNFLESIYFSATGRSHRTNYDKLLIMHEEKEAHIKTIVKNDNITDKIDIHLKTDQKKGIAINGIPIKKLGDLFGILYAVIFSPEDLALIKSGPSERRRFIDMELCQINKVYYHNLNNYYKILKQRNSLLKKIQKDPKLKETLFVWDLQLFEYGEKIIHHRRKFLEKINNISSEIHGNITSHKEKLEVIYKPNVKESEFLAKLKKNYDRDVYMGSTNSGIHKDDFAVFVNNIDARIFGSQGQQRTCSLSLKLAEIELIKIEKNQTPVLLLDDVFSELDQNRQKYLLRTIENIQTILTCTGIENLTDITEKGYLFYVKNGQMKNQDHV